jgi:hypothetical protein
LNDVQVAFAPATGGVLRPDRSLSEGGFQDIVSGSLWDDGRVIGTLSAAGPKGAAATRPSAEGLTELLALVLVGRRGLDAGEGRGDLLAGWHDRTRVFWGLERGERAGTVLSLGICEQTPLFRGDTFAYLEWFARCGGPAQIISVPDERTVHSSAVLLQQLRRTPSEAAAIAEAVHSWLGEHLKGETASFPAFGARAGTRAGRWPAGQSALFALNLLNESMGASPLLETTDLFGPNGLVLAPPPEIVSLSLGAEFAAHFRHKKTGWLIALHDYRLHSFVGQAVRDWLKRDFERLPRSPSDAARDLGALSVELKARTGAVLVVQNLIVTSTADRIPNYSWLGDDFSSTTAVMCAEANAMLADLTRDHDMSLLDSDALAAELGCSHCPDRAHPDRVLVDAQRAELHRILRDRGVPGF